jgi:hypothetical protein
MSILLFLASMSAALILGSMEVFQQSQALPADLAGPAPDGLNSTGQKG